MQATGAMTPGTMRLVIEDGAGTRSTVPFTGDELTVGRALEDVAVRLSDRDVSRRHARFLRANGVVHVEDLGSLTGTRVNGERIAGRRRLREGDLVQIGDYDLALFGEAEAGVAGEPPPLPPTPRPQTAQPSSAEIATEADDVERSAWAAPAGPRTSAIPRATPVVGPPRRAGGDLLRTLLVAVLALALGAAAGWAVGIATHDAPAAPPAVTRP